MCKTDREAKGNIRNKEVRKVKQIKRETEGDNVDKKVL